MRTRIKTFRFNCYGTFYANGSNYAFEAKAFKAGIYFVLYEDGEMRTQMKMNPVDVSRYVATLEDEQERGLLADLQLGPVVCVADEGGEWKVKNRMPL